MPVFRVEKTKNYTTMSNYHLRDKKLSLKSKGLLSLMLSLPDDWDYTLSGLTHITNDGISSIQTAISELQKNCYLQKTQTRDENGRMSKNEYIIFENPQTNKPFTENPLAVKPSTDNHTQQSNKIINTKKQNIDLLNTNQSYPDVIDTMEKYRKIIYDNIEYDLICEQYEIEQLDEIVEIMLECVCSTAQTLRIAKEDIPSEVVKNRMLKINSEHIEYIFWCLKKNTAKVRNIKAYLKSVIYNAPTTMNSFYSAEVNHDLYGTD